MGRLPNGWKKSKQQEDSWSRDSSYGRREIMEIYPGQRGNRINYMNFETKNHAINMKNLVLQNSKFLRANNRNTVIKNPRIVKL